MSPFHWNKTGSWVCCLADWNSTRIGYKGAEGFFSQTPSSQKSAVCRADVPRPPARLGHQLPCPELALNVPKPDIDWAESEQKRLGIQESGYILIHAGSSQLAQAKSIDKIYPAENWQQIIQDFQQRQPDIPVVVEPENDQLVQKLLLVPTSR